MAIFSKLTPRPTGAIVCLCACLFIAPAARAVTNTIIFDLGNFGADAVAFKQVKIEPVYPSSFPRVEGNTVIGIDYGYKQTDANGRLTNAMVSGTYTITFTNRFKATPFQITVPTTNASGSLYASELTTSGTNLPSNLVAYSQTAVNGLFAKITNTPSRWQTNFTNIAAIGITNINLRSNVVAKLTNGTLTIDVVESSASSAAITAANVTNAAQTVRLDALDTRAITNAVFGPGYNHGTWLGSNAYQLLGYRVVGSGIPWSQTGTVGTNHNIRFYPFTSGNGGSFDSIIFSCKAGGSIDVGIYASRNWTNLEPFQCIASTGSNTWSSGDSSYSTNFVLEPGRIYWVAAGFLVTGGTFQFGAVNSTAGINTDFTLALTSAAFQAAQPHSWEMVNCFSNSLPAQFPTSGFSIVGQTATAMFAPIAIKGN